MVAIKFEAGELEAKNVYKSFGRGKEALENVTFRVERGKFTVLCGPSGCGKTTLINLLAGYILPDLGEVFLDGKPVKGPGWDRLVVFQESALFPWKTVWDNIMFGPMVQGKDRKEAEEKTQYLIDKVALTGFERKFPHQLSGGMQRRAELIRALINEPRVMLMDEPFRGLDAMTRELMQEHIIKLYEETKMTILFITAELEEAIYLGDVAYFMTVRPGTIKRRMDINLPRPRIYKHIATPEYVALEKTAIQIVDEEAVKAFSQLRKVGAKPAA
ncbi:MAG: Taurine import ATP-binding protein TauB [Syntrophomonadaceae bacterium]|nr:Taurine import ATP-binding protein TauB [Bacillota bacterium]